MRAGGRLEGDLWKTRVRSLREGDCVRAGSWHGSFWGGGERLIVSSVPQSTGLRDGFYRFSVAPIGCPEDMRELVIRPDDDIELASRETTPKPPPVKKAKPKKGQQLSLFED